MIVAWCGVADDLHSHLHHSVKPSTHHSREVEEQQSLSLSPAADAGGGGSRGRRGGGLGFCPGWGLAGILYYLHFEHTLPSTFAPSPCIVLLSTAGVLWVKTHCLHMTLPVSRWDLKHWWSNRVTHWPAVARKRAAYAPNHSHTHAGYFWVHCAQASSYWKMCKNCGRI